MSLCFGCERSVYIKQSAALSRLGLPGLKTVCLDFHDQFPESLLGCEQGNRVVVTLRHLAAVEAAEQRRVFSDDSLRRHQYVAEMVIEALCYIPRHLDMLLLVAADRNLCRLEHQDIGRHQDRVAVQRHRNTLVGVFVATFNVRLHRRFVGVSTVHEALRRHAGQDPG